MDWTKSFFKQPMFGSSSTCIFVFLNGFLWKVYSKNDDNNFSVGTKSTARSVSNSLKIPTKPAMREDGYCCHYVWDAFTHLKR